MMMKFMMTCFAASAFIQADNVVRLIPPTITQETISEEIVCDRPMRLGSFNISTEIYADKQVVNCYGHGGAGCTTLWGSIDRAISLFEESNPSKDEPIHVIGAGFMGLASACELSRLGYNVAQITAKDLYYIPSWRAAGYFAIVSVKTSPEEEEVLNNICMDSFRTYQNIEKGNHPYISSNAVKYMPVYCSEQTDSGIEELEVKGLIPPREHVTLDFGNGVTHPNYVKFMTYYMNTTEIMQQLHQQVDKLGIPIVIDEVKSFDELTEKVIFNCSGLGGKDLNQDAAMVAIRGHLTMLTPSAGTDHLEYMIYTKVEQDGKERYVYMFPKTLSITAEHPEGRPCASCLGGTFIDVNALSEEEVGELDKVEFKKQLDRNSIFFTGKPFLG